MGAKAIKLLSFMKRTSCLLPGFMNVNARHMRNEIDVMVYFKSLVNE